MPFREMTEYKAGAEAFNAGLGVTEWYEDEARFVEVWDFFNLPEWRCGWWDAQDAAAAQGQGW